MPSKEDSALEAFSKRVREAMGGAGDKLRAMRPIKAASDAVAPYVERADRALKPLVDKTRKYDESIDHALRWPGRTGQAIGESIGPPVGSRENPLELGDLVKNAIKNASLKSGPGVRSMIGGALPERGAPEAMSPGVEDFKKNQASTLADTFGSGARPKPKEYPISRVTAEDDESFPGLGGSSTRPGTMSAEDRKAASEPERDTGGPLAGVTAKSMIAEEPFSFDKDTPSRTGSKNPASTVAAAKAYRDRLAAQGR